MVASISSANPPPCQSAKYIAITALASTAKCCSVFAQTIKYAAFINLSYTLGTIVYEASFHTDALSNCSETFSLSDCQFQSFKSCNMAGFTGIYALREPGKKLYTDYISSAHCTNIFFLNIAITTLGFSLGSIMHYESENVANWCFKQLEQESNN